jgi:hypothetical protein
MSKHRPPRRHSLPVREPSPRLRPRPRPVWVPVAAAVGAIAVGVIVAATSRAETPRAPVVLAPTSTAPPPPSRTTAAQAGVPDGSYDVTDHPIASGTWSAPGGARCAWSVRNAAGSTMLQGSGAAAQKVDLRAGLNFRSSGCGPWVRA